MNWARGGLSGLLGRRSGSADAASERMRLLFKDERGEADDRMMAGIREDVLASIERHTGVPVSSVQVRLSKVEGSNTLEIDMRLPGGRRAGRGKAGAGARA